MKKRIGLIPTYKDNDLNYTNFYELNNFSYSKDFEIDYSSLTSKLDNEYKDFNITLVGPEPFLWSNIDTFMSKYGSRVERIQSSLYFDDVDKFNTFIETYSNLKITFLITKPSLYIGKYSYNDIKNRFTSLKNNIDFITIFYKLSDFKTFFEDINDIKNFSSKDIEPYLIYEPGFASIVESFSSSDLSEFKTFISSYSSTYSKNLFDVESITEGGYIINPDNVTTMANIQNINKTCSTCYGLAYKYSAVCSNCIKFSNNNWNITSKNLYISEIERIKNILK